MVRTIEAVVEQVQPAIVLTHFGSDLNIDHRIVSQAVLTAVHSIEDQVINQIMFFEVPSSTEWQVSTEGRGSIPNWLEDISLTL